MNWRRQLVSLVLPIVATAQNNSRAVPECASCHSEAKSQPGTSMAHALESVAECKVLIDHPVLTTKQGPYSYRIERTGNQSLYSVSDGAHELTMSVKWAMGASSAIGQTYILEKDGALYESRVSYFSELNGLASTLGSQNSTPRNLSEAAGRLMGLEDKLRCFGCHATNATSGRQLTLERMLPGLRCDRCHQSSAAHLAEALLGNFTGTAAAKPEGPTARSPEEISNFCGQCHRTWEEIPLLGRLDIA